ncbi:hypothetical protein ebA5962 [Aromatoleum aromaticum EbN1]|uniref:Uncharacterized protein n=1 Tax=Aromatoleum aromaticum (strain DSM 19018 / LMG 30748 / EbN1) TaxID=76114 RepID=Q5NZI9_AROAE|nr:hypothetical protein ebA5962 [Aromatoleum aromaticum EbN1]
MIRTTLEQFRYLAISFEVEEKASTPRLTKKDPSDPSASGVLFSRDEHADPIVTVMTMPLRLPILATSSKRSDDHVCGQFHRQTRHIESAH